MNKNDITIVISSKKQGDEMDGFLKEVRESSGCNPKIIFVTNDGNMGLSELYGSLLSNTTIDTEIMVFCHDDIEFLRPGWGKEIVRLFKENRKYGIIGVAGSDYFGSKESDGSDSMWWAYKDHIYGQVLHRHDGKSWLTAFSPLLKKDLEEVCVIDGLFMAVHRKRISKNFDKDVPNYDFYDIDFCLANYLDGKCKIGVTTNIRLAHNSIGNLKDGWFKNRELICNKYADEMPIIVSKTKKK